MKSKNQSSNNQKNNNNLLLSSLPLLQQQNENQNNDQNDQNEMINDKNEINFLKLSNDEMNKEISFLQFENPFQLDNEEEEYDEEMVDDETDNNNEKDENQSINTSSFSIFNQQREILDPTSKSNLFSQLSHNLLSFNSSSSSSFNNHSSYKARNQKRNHKKEEEKEILNDISIFEMLTISSNPEISFINEIQDYFVQKLTNFFYHSPYQIILQIIQVFSF